MEIFDIFQMLTVTLIFFPDSLSLSFHINFVTKQYESRSKLFLNCRMPNTQNPLCCTSHNLKSKFFCGILGDEGEDKNSVLRQRQLNADSLTQFCQPQLPKSWCKATAAYLQTQYWHRSIPSLVLRMCLRTSGGTAQKARGEQEGRRQRECALSKYLESSSWKCASLYQTLISCEVHAGLFISPLKRTKIRGQL